MTIQPIRTAKAADWRTGYPSVCYPPGTPLGCPGTPYAQWGCYPGGYPADFFAKRSTGELYRERDGYRSKLWTEAEGLKGQDDGRTKGGLLGAGVLGAGIAGLIGLCGGGAAFALGAAAVGAVIGNFLGGRMGGDYGKKLASSDAVLEDAKDARLNGDPLPMDEQTPSAEETRPSKDLAYPPGGTMGYGGNY